jgi:glycerol-3-phosphate acyltransferase PlsX
MKRRLDWAEQGGAPLLGVAGGVVLCHGASPPVAIKNAILGAGKFTTAGLLAKLEQAIARQRAALGDGASLESEGVSKGEESEG